MDEIYVILGLSVWLSIRCTKLADLVKTLRDKIKTKI